MTNIDSHHYPSNDVVRLSWDMYQRKLPSIPEKLGFQMENFGHFMRITESQIGLGHLLSKGQSDICIWAHLELQIAVGLFEATYCQGAAKTTPIEVLGTAITVPTGRTRFGSDSQWMRGFAFGMLLRDESAMKSLANHNPHGSYETHTALWGDALIMWLIGDQDPTQVLELAAGYTDEDEYQPELAVKVHKPLILATQAIYDGDATRFNECLAEALRGHKAVLGTGEAANSPANLLSFEALGLCALAYDRGLPIEVESGYIPQWIYEGGCKERPDLQAYVKEVSGG